jgi:hypothetical protein
MGCILCCFPKKYNEIDTNINSKTNTSTNKKYNKKYNKNYNRPNNGPFLLTDSQLQSFDNILLENNKNNRKKSDIYRKWRQNYLDNSGKLYI